MRWIPGKPKVISQDSLLQRLGNKLLYPVTVPAVIEDLWAEQAAAREALRLSFADHLQIARVPKEAGIFGEDLLAKTIGIDISMIDLIIGSGGVLSNAPNRLQAAAMLLDAFEPVGVTELMVDSIFMLPHLGAFSRMNESAALQILERECLIHLGTALTPQGWVEPGVVGIELNGTSSSGRAIRGVAAGGTIVSLPLAHDETADVTVTVRGNARWVGANKLTVRGGVAGIILDMRGRPLQYEDGKLDSYDMEWMWQS